MTPLSNEEEGLFRDALEHPVGSERQAFLKLACEGNEALLRRVEALLEAHDNPATFPELDVPQPAKGTIRPEFAEEEFSGTRIGRYKLLQRIGEGGMGVVYMAEQEEPVRRRVALKIIKLGMDTKQVIARFESERQALALMDHPNIAKVLDGGATDTGRLYFVMELVRGITITEYCDQHILSTRDRLDLFCEVCHAVQHAHQKGIIHRDLKPSNVMITLHDGVPVPKVIDFGIAKATTDQRLTDKTLFTALEQFIGTPAYMSPEQAEMSGLDIDTRCDIYSLGVLLYELLTGKTPFDPKELLASGLDGMRRTIREREPVRPSTRLSTMLEGELTATARQRKSESLKLVHLVRGDVDWIVMKCLEKDRARRYETANGLASDIQRHLSNEAVLARPPSAAYRFQKMVRRNKLAFAAAATVAATLIAGLSFSTWAFLSEAEQRRVAVTQRTNAVRAQEAEKKARLRADGEKTAAERHLYVANLNLAQEAWAQNNVERLEQLLEETRNSPNRGFEWSYWQHQTHSALKTLHGDAMLSSASFSPDGLRIAVGSSDGTVKVWDWVTGRESLTLAGHSGEIYSVVFFPGGQRILTGSWDRTARVWDAVSGTNLLTLVGHKSQIYCVAISPDGRRIVSGSFEYAPRVWDAASGRQLFTLAEHKGGVAGVAFSADSKRIVTGGGDGKANVSDAATGRKLLTIDAHASVVSSVAFSPDGQQILTGSLDRTAKLWGAASGQLLRTFLGHGEAIWSVAFSSNGTRIATASSDQTARVWDATTGLEILRLRGHTAGINCVAFSSDDRRIITASGDKTVKIWDAAQGCEPLSLRGHTNLITAVAFSGEGQRILSGSLDKTVKVWDAVSGHDLLTLGGESPVWSAAFSPDGLRLVTGNEDQVAQVWDVAKVRVVVLLKGHRAPVYSAAFSPDGLRIVTGGGDRTAIVWEAASGRMLFRLTGHTAPIYAAAFSPDGLRVATGSADRTAIIWDVADALGHGEVSRKLHVLQGHDDPITSVAFSPDGERVVTGSRDRTVRIWETGSGQEVGKLEGHTGAILCVSFSPDGRRIVTGSEDHTARLWEAASGQQLLALVGHGGPIRSLSFSPDGQRIVTGSEDSTARVWEAARPEQLLAWRQEEKTVNEQLGLAQRERTKERERTSRVHDEGAIKRWLVLAPIPLAAGQSGVEAPDAHQVESQNRLRPSAGEATATRDGELRWREVTQEDYLIDFNSILRNAPDQGVAYAVSYIRSEGEQRGLRMLVGSDDEASVFLNGEQVYRSPIGRGFIADEDTVPGLVLHAGLNVIVFKVVNEGVAWLGSIRFTDAIGEPIRGLTVTLNPELNEGNGSQHP